MIRDALLDDVPAIIEMGERFVEEAKWSAVGLTFNEDDCARTLIGMVESDSALLMVAEQDGRPVGMFGGLFYPSYFNASFLMGQELFWWVEPTVRNGIGGEMLAEAERKAKAAGCRTWSMICLETGRPETMGRLYRRRGYRGSERSFIKEL